MKKPGRALIVMILLGISLASVFSLSWIEIRNLKTDKEIYSPGEVITLTFTLINHGTSTEKVTLFIYLGELAVDEKDITLAPRESKELVFYVKIPRYIEGDVDLFVRAVTEKGAEFRTQKLISIRGPDIGIEVISLYPRIVATREGEAVTIAMKLKSVRSRIQRVYVYHHGDELLAFYILPEEEKEISVSFTPATAGINSLTLCTEEGCRDVYFMVVYTEPKIQKIEEETKINITVSERPRKYLILSQSYAYLAVATLIVLFGVFYFILRRGV